MQDATDAHVVDVETTAAQCLEEIHNPFAVAHGPQQRRRVPQIIDVGANADQVTGDALQFSHEQADVLGAPGRLKPDQLFDGSGIGNLVEHRGEVVGIIQVADTAHVRTILQGFLDAAMQVANDRGAVLHRLPFQGQHEAKYPVGTGVLGAQIQKHLLRMLTLGGSLFHSAAFPRSQLHGCCRR